MSFILTKGVLQQQANRAGGGVPTDGLISYWKLDETSGPVVDSWGDNDGTNEGALRGVEGKVGNAFEFDGKTHVETEDIQIVPRTGCFTINGWVNLNIELDDDSYNTFMGAGEIDVDDIMFFASRGGIVRLYTRSSGYILDGPDIRGDGWTMLSVTREGDEFTLRVNKEIVDTTESSSVEIGRKIFIGVNANLNWKIKGKEDEIGIWERSLTDKEFDQLYNDGKGTTL